MERTQSSRIYNETHTKIKELLSQYGIEAEKEFFKEYSKVVVQRPNYH